MTTDYAQNIVRQLQASDACGFLAAVLRNGGSLERATADFKTVNPDGRRRLELLTRAAVAPGTTTDPAWAAPLVRGSAITEAIVEAARAASVLARMPFVPVPPDTPIAVETQPPAAAWVGEGIPIPATKMGFAMPRVPAAKVATIVALSSELVKLGTPAASTAIRNAMAAAIAKAADLQLLGTAAPIPTVSPGGIFNGVTPLTPSGTTAAAAAKDAANVVATFLAAVPDASAAVFVVPPATAALLKSQYPLETIGVLGGSFMGLPAVVSPSVGNKIAAVDCGRLLVSDDGLELDVSQYASVQMDTAPDAPVTAATIVQSFWQADLVGVKAIRFLSWIWGTATPQATLCSPTAYVPGT